MPEDPNTQAAGATGAGNETQAGGQQASPANQENGGDEDFESILSKAPESFRKHYSKLKTEIVNKRESLKSSSEENKQLKEKVHSFESEKSKAEEEQAKAKGEFEKLYNESKANSEKLAAAMVRTEIASIARAEGINDDVLISLIPTEKVKLGKDFEISGAREAVLEFKTAKPNFFKELAAASRATGSSAVTPNPASKSNSDDVRSLDPLSKDYAERRKEFLAKR